MSTSQPSTSKQTTTQSQLITCFKTWTIKNYSRTKGIIQLPTFTDSQYNRFAIILNLKKGDDPFSNDQLGCIEVFVFSSIPAYVTLYILSQDNTKCFLTENLLEEFLTTTVSGEYLWHLHEYISNYKLRYGTCLPNDKLTLVCETRYTVQNPSKISLIRGWINSLNPSATQLKVLEDIRHLLTNMVHTNVIFSVNGKQQLLANKVILSVRSPVFAKMFKDTKVMYRETVKIKAVDFKAFKVMLGFLQTGNVPPLEKKLAQDLLAAADKYQVDQLKSICENYFCNQKVTINRATDWLPLAGTANSAKLKEKCVEFIKSRCADEGIETGELEPERLLTALRLKREIDYESTDSDE